MSKPAGQILAHRGQRLTHPLDMPEGIQIDAQAREDERRYIARELHDTVIQPLASLVMSFTLLERQAPLPPGITEGYLGSWKELAQEALDSMRATLSGLRLHSYAQIGLPETIREYLIPQLRSRGLLVAFECRDWPGNAPIEWTSHLYLIVREALTNVEKHSGASQVRVKLEASDRLLRVSVSDNGVGFRRGQPSHERTGFGAGLGLISMRDRVRMIGGHLTLTTAPGHGVRVTVRLPRPQFGDTPDSASCAFAATNLAPGRAGYARTI